MKGAVRHQERKEEAVRCQILSCQSCSLSAQPTVTPVPLAGPIPSDICVIAEAPGAHENAEGAPLVGPSGRKAKKWLTTAGIPWSEVVRLNVVSCYPARTPNQSEIDACAHNFVAQIELARPKLALVLGKVAFSRFWLNLPLAKARGHFWLERIGAIDLYLMATWHPSFVLRQGEEEKAAVEGQVFRDMAIFASGVAAVRANKGPVSAGGCAMCGRREKVRPSYRRMSFCAECEPAEVLLERHFPGFGRVNVDTPVRSS